MGNFRREGGFGGGKRFGGRDGGRREGGFDRPRPEMHKATCAECGSSCEVPFKPSGDRPVLCSDCFKNSGRGEDRGERRDGGRREGGFDRSRSEDREMFGATCAACGSHCQVPFRPRPGKEVFCDACFGKEGGNEAKSLSPFSVPAPKSANYDKQFEALNNKLNKIIELLTIKSEVVVVKQIVKPSEAIVKKEVVKEVAKVEIKKSEKKEDKKVVAKKKASKKK